MTAASDSFRARFLAGELMLGTFIKTPTTHATEILGGVGFDFVVIDEEHAPFDRVTIDTVLLAARASHIAGIVRVAEPTPAKLLAVLFSVEKAKDMVAACRYRGGKRGFSNSPRAGGYGKLGVWDHVDKADASATVIAMIEDPEALDVIDAIVAVEGLDGVFIGRGDLTVAMGATGSADPRVRAAAEKIIAAARRAGKPVCIMVADAKEAQDWRALGASAFIVASDQGFMRQAATRTRAEFSALPAGQVPGAE